MNSQYPENAPWSNAVDGRRGGSWEDDGCASSQNEINPWIMVDLEQQYVISSMYIVNREVLGRI